MAQEHRKIRQHLGQHFLGDIYWREEIARAIRVLGHLPTPAHDSKVAEPSWIEIGPGHGEMTEYLAGSGLPVHAIELDESLIGGLNRIKKKFANLEVIYADILKSDLRTIAGGRRIRVYGSLPYYITSPILHHLFQFAELIDEIHVVVQTEVAERMAAEPGGKEYGYLSVVTQLHSRPEIVLEIPRAAFSPPPEVGSSLVTLRVPGEWAKLRGRGVAFGGPGSLSRQTIDDEDAFLMFVKSCFSKKRKTLVNNLRETLAPDNIRQALTAVGLRADVRAEQISIPQLADLYVALWNPKTSTDDGCS